MNKDHLVLCFLWLFFCALHSILAGMGIKKSLQQNFGAAYKYYRLFYSVFAFVTLGIVLYYLLTIPSPYLFTPTLLTYTLGGLVAATGLVIMGICIKKYFMSLSGLKSLFQDHPTNKLMIRGIHRFVRHPLYLGTFIFIWGLLIILPHLSLLISNIFITTYTLIGIELEENKLVAEFGEDYKTYQREVPKIIPRRLRRA